MIVEVTARSALRFDDGTPVRAASAVAPLGDGWVIAQDDATHVAWRRPGGTVAVRAFPAVDGHDTFSSAEGTKHLKPDVETAVAVDGGVLLLGSGSTPARMRASLLRLDGAKPSAHAADLAPLYAAVAEALGIGVDRLNLEGACLVDGRLRWFQRGNAAAGVASASVDLDPAALLAAMTRPRTAGSVAVTGARSYDLGAVGGVALAVTDAVALPGGRVLLSAAAEDTPNAYDDGPVVGAALILLDGGTPVATAHLPLDGADVVKVEGLAVHAADRAGADLIAVVDADDPDRPATELRLRVRW